MPTCSQCGRQFSRPFTLRRHQATAHNNDEQQQRYSCPECPETFARKDLLTRHIAEFHVEPPETCSNCGRSFRRRYMRTHASSCYHGSQPSSYISSTDPPGPANVVTNDHQWCDDPYRYVSEPQHFDNLESSTTDSTEPSALELLYQAAYQLEGYSQGNERRTIPPWTSVETAQDLFYVGGNFIEDGESWQDLPQSHSSATDPELEGLLGTIWHDLDLSQHPRAQPGSDVWNRIASYAPGVVNTNSDVSQEQNLDLHDASMLDCPINTKDSDALESRLLPSSTQASIMEALTQDYSPLPTSILRDITLPTCHMRSTTSIRKSSNKFPSRYHCESCHKIFTRLSDLSRHTRSFHEIPNMYRCKVMGCSYMSKRQDKLKEHCRKMHTDSEGDRYVMGGNTNNDHSKEHINLEQQACPISNRTQIDQIQKPNHAGVETNT